MSADIDINSWGEANAMFAKVAWHRLGTVVGEAFSIDEAVAAGLDIVQPVEKVKVADLILAYEAQPDEYAAVRNGRVLATGLGEQWTPFQVVDAYDFGRCVRQVNGEQGDLLSLGAIDRGRKWFMTYDLGEFSIGDYKVRDYLSLNGSFDSSWVFSALTSPIVEVCANTIAAAKAAGTTHYRFKHTSGIKDRVEQAKLALRRHQESRDGFIALGESLLQTPVSASQYSQLVQSLFPVTDETHAKTRNVHEDAREKVTALYKGQGGFVDSVGNGWSVVQAVNTYENWGAPVRNTKGRDEATTRATKQIEQLIDGRQPLTERAIDLVGALN